MADEALLEVPEASRWMGRVGNGGQAPHVVRAATDDAGIGSLPMHVKRASRALVMAVDSPQQSSGGQIWQQRGAPPILGPRGAFFLRRKADGDLRCWGPRAASRCLVCSMFPRGRGRGQHGVGTVLDELVPILRMMQPGIVLIQGAGSFPAPTVLDQFTGHTMFEQGSGGRTSDGVGLEHGGVDVALLHGEQGQFGDAFTAQGKLRVNTGAQEAGMREFHVLMHVSDGVAENRARNAHELRVPFFVNCPEEETLVIIKKQCPCDVGKVTAPHEGGQAQLHNEAGEVKCFCFLERPLDQWFNAGKKGDIWAAWPAVEPVSWPL